jgi:hypothetical protein
MAYGEHDFDCDQGSTFNTSVQYKQTDANGALIPVHLAGYSARMDVRYALTKEADSVVSLTSVNGGATVNGTGSAGQVDLLISATDTAALTPGTYFYDLEIFTGSGNGGFVDRLIQGKFTVSAEVTNV